MASLLRGFVDSVSNYPNRVALYLDNQRWTYAELANAAGTITTSIAEEGLSKHRLVGLMASESLTTYAGVLGILGEGRGFVPIDPAHPPARILDAVRRSGIDTLVVGPEAIDRLDGLLEKISRPLAIIAPEIDDLRGLRARQPRHRYHVGTDVTEQPPSTTILEVPGDDPAYLLHTSGSTGAPRGVVVTCANLRSYLDSMERRFPVGPGDRCSHSFPMTFDLSVHDLLTTWSSGATLVAWSSARRTDPARFIGEHRLTRWFSVPTVAMTMERLGDLTPRRFPSLEQSFFCGEPLPVSVARSWQKAAPDSQVINLYGPTEATVAIAAHRFRDGDQYDERGVVPLGRIFAGQDCRVVDEENRPLPPGGRGELLLAGSQVTNGYLNDDVATRQRFVQLADNNDNKQRRWFRTGDLVEADDDGVLHFLGRLDEQIKLRGHHVELSEVDRALRRACGHEMAAAVPWPSDDTGVYGLVALIATDEPLDTSRLLAGCRRYLPNSMVPDRIIGLRQLPRNDRGKLDRRAMQSLLQHREV